MLGPAVTKRPPPLLRALRRLLLLVSLYTAEVFVFVVGIVDKTGRNGMARTPFVRLKETSGYVYQILPGHFTLSFDIYGT